MMFLCKREKRSKTAVKVLTKGYRICYDGYVGAPKASFFYSELGIAGNFGKVFRAVALLTEASKKEL